MSVHFEPNVCTKGNTYMPLWRKRMDVSTLALSLVTVQRIFRKIRIKYIFVKSKFYLHERLIPYFHKLFNFFSKFGS